MMLPLTLTQWAAWLPLYFLPFCRIIALFSTAPIIGEKAVTLRLRVGLALLFTLLLPVKAHPNTLALASLNGVLLIIREIVIGLALGLAMQFMFAALRVAGEVIALQMGLSFASFYDTSSHSSLSIVSRLITNLGFLVFISLDGLLWMVDQLAQSFQQLSPYTLSTIEAPMAALTQLATTIFSEALQLSLPLIFLLLCINMALGLLNRMAPQFSAFVIGFPLTLLLGVVALYYSMPLLIEGMQEFMRGFEQHLLENFR